MQLITKEYLRKHKDHVFVYGDNVIRRGHGGGASLRDEPNTWGFITKMRPTNDDLSFFTKTEYKPVLDREMADLKNETFEHPEKIYLISPIGSGLANKYGIWEMIEPEMDKLKELRKNVILLWKDEEEIKCPYGMDATEEDCKNCIHYWDCQEDKKC